MARVILTPVTGLRPGFVEAELPAISPRIAPLLLLAVLAAGCARPVGPDESPAASAERALRTERVQIVSARDVTVTGERRAGVLPGMAAGGLLGSLFGGGSGRVVGAALGVAVGAALGMSAAEDAGTHAGREYIVRTDRDELFTVVQGPVPMLQPGHFAYLQTDPATGWSRVVR